MRRETDVKTHKRESNSEAVMVVLSFALVLKIFLWNLAEVVDFDSVLLFFFYNTSEQHVSAQQLGEAACISLLVASTHLACTCPILIGSILIG